MKLNGAIYSATNIQTMKKQLLIGPFRQLLTLDKLPLKGALQDENLEIIEEAGIRIQGEIIVEVGIFSEMKSGTNTEIINLDGDWVALPGWVDCHTHICFGGTRAKDFSMRNSGKSYLEIAASGGGIWDTVTQTRKLTQSELAKKTSANANRHLKDGVTTIEVKSGYGLSIEEELKMLRSIQEASSGTKADLVPTCLTAHMKPRDFEGTNSEYLQEMSQKLLPQIKSENLSNRVDAFIEKSTFSPEEISPYFEAAKELGFDITVHADQFTSGGSKVAVAFQAKSADHLEVLKGSEISLLAKSTTIAVALPGASIGLGCDFTPARKILDQGGSLAIASDWNPGSAPMGDLLAQSSILATFQKLSTAEVFAALTFRAASTLSLTDRGILKEGMLADFNLFPTKNYQEILYHQGRLKPAQVWKKGSKM